MLRVCVKGNSKDAKPHIVVFKEHSLNFLFREASAKLGVRVSRGFLDIDGQLDSVAEIKSIDEISPNDTIICTAGEPCWKENDLGGREELIRVAVFGGGGVGKSALTLRYVRDFFVKGWDPTIEDAYMKTVEMDDGTKVQLEILDTAGQGDFQSLRPHWMVEKEGYIFVFGLDKEGSDKELDAYYELYEQLKDDYEDPKVIMLVGNKKDKVDESPSTRIMSVEDGEALAERWGAEYIETSAKTGENVDVLFSKLINNVREIKQVAVEEVHVEEDEPLVQSDKGCCSIM
mmetsp:Transcript_20594/g.30219  ORF Transcript_20594/g.30219 Transcript_20594/m.30219 type:complete len:288 (-) Transcript_20594:119-982(-)|eukprot:CAMPEP_0195525362 /NCGR_PEP_ID=MMETSP0794_2-20130614/25788_1 /TAXON_ID=515487 /ORGANISM="Stephanopyxis turris, Strain CCMP 815" /LENGTH=287 /DNA_ID=CAMNT_0040655817 /DNA_START=134 /DNA_END=997 /DNA_ORIENTATION=-